MKKVTKTPILALFVMAIISSCAPVHKDLYFWGEYENILLGIYERAGNADLNVQIDTLNRDIQQAASQGLAVAPGVYAHLGFVYASQGNIVESVESFEKEKQNFPESAAFIDGLMERARKDKK